jgi:hypothetical protein
MARIARTRVHFVETAVQETSPGVITRDYNVEIHQGQRRWTVGRIMGGRRSWAALPVGAKAWTRWHATRAAALSALQMREDCQDERTWIRA